jgi:hypothetical protein
MARAASVKTPKSRQPASNSATSTASRARKAQNDASNSDAQQGDSWEKREADQAAMQGWELFECIDETTLKIFYEIGPVDGEEPLVQPASHVAELARKGDALAIKALRMVFRSKTRIDEVTKKRRK